MVKSSSIPRPRLAVLFWFYTDAQLCRNHIELFRQTNPDTVVYGLYGGKPEHEQEFRAVLGPYLADFYTSPETDSKRKWRHGDLMIADWYRQRGQHLEWQSIFVLQWDALVFANLDTLFHKRRPDQLFFSGYKPITTDMIEHWYWTSSQQPKERALYERFQRSVRQAYPQATEQSDCWHMCVFVFEILTRTFLNQYATLPDPELGFLEYKIATYAHLWGYDVYTHSVGLYGKQDDLTLEEPVNALGKEISDELIMKSLQDPDGWRLFHPYFKEWKLSASANE